jgi:hypothetical protein
VDSHRHLIDITRPEVTICKLFEISMLRKPGSDRCAYRTSRDDPGSSYRSEVRNASFPGIPMILLLLGPELQRWQTPAKSVRRTPQVLAHSCSNIPKFPRDSPKHTSSFHYAGGLVLAATLWRDYEVARHTRQSLFDCHLQRGAVAYRLCRGHPLGARPQPCFASP